MVKRKNIKYDKFILPIEARSSTELKKHTSGPGKRYVFADHNNNPTGNIYTILRTVKNVKNPPQHIEIHRHDCDSLWMFVGNKKDLTGLKIEVFLGNKIYKLNSPASIYIPQGVRHTYRFIEGSGNYINIVLAKNGRYNTSTK